MSSLRIAHPIWKSQHAKRYIPNYLYHIRSYFHISIDLLTYLFTTKGKASIDRKVSISNEGLRPDIGDRHAHRQAIRAD